MNRHQSNPFLAGWEENEVDTNVISSPKTTDGAGRRFSSSQADLNNPSGSQRAADRRLYLRNMSSFEAASLHQQQMQANGASTNTEEVDPDYIAKMTAAFQSAMETNDQRFTETLNDNGDPLDFNPFDPFETIVDDDVSIPTSVTSVSINNSQTPNLESKADKDNSSDINTDTNNIDRPNDISFDPQHPISNLHDSIDDDDEELVSTPVRNIKAPTQNVMIDSALDEVLPSQLSRYEYYSNKPNILSPPLSPSADLKNTKKDSGLDDATDSMAKASLFASLLASAEPSCHQRVLDEEICDGLKSDVNKDDNASPVNMEFSTHVIKGSSSSPDGNSNRPVGFFDPFETVIDKDALTSLMNGNQNLATKGQVIESGKEAFDANLSDADEVRVKFDYVQNETVTPGAIDESLSIETVIENPDAEKNNVSKIPTGDLHDQQDIDDRTLDYHAIPRPTKPSNTEIGQNLPNTVQDIPKMTPIKVKVNKTRKKPSFQEDSSDSDEDDGRIQITINARDPSKITENQAGPTVVPLLPPPPSKSSIKQIRERGQVEDLPSPFMSYKSRKGQRKDSDSSDDEKNEDNKASEEVSSQVCDAQTVNKDDVFTKDETRSQLHDEESEDDDHVGQFVIPMNLSEGEEEDYERPETPLYDEDTSYVLEDFPAKYEGSGWEMMLRYPPKKKLTSNRFWKKIFVKLAQVPVASDGKSKSNQEVVNEPPQTCLAIQIFDKPDDKKPMQEIPIQVTYTVSDISSQQFDQLGKIFTIKLQYILYKERVGIRQGQIARLIHTGHIGTSTTSGGHGVDPLSIGAIKKIGAPIEHSPQVSQIIKLGCTSYSDIKQFKICLEDYLFKIPITRDRALASYKTEEVQMAVRDETYLELNQVGTIIKNLARVRIFFLSFMNGMPTVEVGINDIRRQGKEVVGRKDILPVMTEEWIRLEDCQLHNTVDQDEFNNPESKIVKLVPPDATFFELLRFRVRPPRNRELPLQITADMSVTRTKVSINCEVMVPGCVSRKHGQIPCEDIAIRVTIPECWIYFFREEKHFRMGSKKSVNRRPGKVKGLERFLGGGGGLMDIDESSLIEVTSGQAKYEHHHHAIVWRAARWPKESQSAYVQNTMKIRLPLTAYDKMPDTFYQFVYVEYSMPATTVSHTTLRSVSVNPCDDEPPEKYVKYSAKYEYKVKMRLSVNLGAKASEPQSESSPIVIMKQPDLHGDLQREEDSDDDSDEEADDAKSSAYQD